MSNRRIAAKRWLGGPIGSRKPTTKLAAWEFDEAFLGQTKLLTPMPTLLFSWGGTSYGRERECVAFVIGSFWLHLGPSRQCLWGAGNAGEEDAAVLPLPPVCTRCCHRGKPVRFLTWGRVVYRWLSGMGTNEPPVWKYRLLWSMVASGCFPLPFMSNPSWQQSLVNAFKGPGMEQCLAKEWNNNGDWRNGFY